MAQRRPRGVSFTSDSLALVISATYPPHSSQPLGGNETILLALADGGPGQADAAFLSGLGYRVLQAANADEAVALLGGDARVELLISSGATPDGSPDGALPNEARVLQPGIEVLLITETTDEAADDVAPDPHATLLGKPYSQNELAIKVRHVFANRALVAALRARVDAFRQAAASPTAAAKEGTLRILLVEDEPDALESLLEVLNLSGYPAEGASNGEQALAMLSQGDFTVLMTDIHLPGMSGRELAAQAVARHAGLKVIFASGLNAGEREMPGAVWLTKPFEFDALFAVLDEARTCTRPKPGL